LHANTTAHLLADIERLRTHLGIARWWVVGGSWGGGLGVAYASQHPDRCLGAVLRSVFLSRPQDIAWFFAGAQMYLPDAWAALSHHWYDQNGLRDIVALLQTEDQAVPLAQAWHAWEQALTLRHWSGSVQTLSPVEAAKAQAKYRLQSHYLSHRCFFPQEGLLAHVSAMAHMPVTLVHGRLDWVCRPEAAWALHQQLPKSQLHWVDDAGHSPFEAAMTPVWVRAIHQALASHFA
jgi:proline iminopeptidase